MASDRGLIFSSLMHDLRALLRGERDRVANAANTAALLYHCLDEVNWVGFYFLRGQELVLGPFQGRPACVRIAVGQGVCGAAVARREAVVVPDVHAFPGHIACDAASRSEVVVPLHVEGIVVGVLDVDSPRLHRFDSVDAEHLADVAAFFVESCDWGQVTSREEE